MLTSDEMSREYVAKQVALQPFLWQALFHCEYSLKTTPKSVKHMERKPIILLRCTISTCNTHTHTFNSPLSGTTRVSWYRKGKTNLDFTEARDSEWQWHQLGHMQVCTSLQTDNHASTPLLSFLQAGCPS